MSLYLTPQPCCNSVPSALSAGRAGGTPFVYQSGTRNKGSKSYMGGFFTFVEGTIQAPTGPQFDVQVRLPSHSMAASLQSGTTVVPYCCPVCCSLESIETRNSNTATACVLQCPQFLLEKPDFVF